MRLATAKSADLIEGVLSETPLVRALAEHVHAALLRLPERGTTHTTEPPPPAPSS